jgi:RHS repeat-associated protein
VAGSPATTVASCYDAADRLIGTTVTNPVTGASPVNQSLSSGQIVYDAHGNTVKLADEALTYDGGDRHTKTVLDDGSKVTYVRDTTDRIVQRTETTPNGQVTATRYGFTGDGDTPDFVLDGSSSLTEWDLSLPGGATAELRGSTSSWSYPNSHGDIIVTADSAGARAAGVAIYDPFGQVEDPTTGLLGTVTANQAGPDTQAGSADYGWLGQHQKLSEHLGSIATIEMGARQYVAALGRFLQVDPIEGGTDDDHAYANDPMNAFDLSGKAAKTCGSWNAYCNKSAVGLITPRLFTHYLGGSGKSVRLRWSNFRSNPAFVKVARSIPVGKSRVWKASSPDLFLALGHFTIKRTSKNTWAIYDKYDFRPGNHEDDKLNKYLGIPTRAFGARDYEVRASGYLP